MVIFKTKYKSEVYGKRDCNYFCLSTALTLQWEFFTTRSFVKGQLYCAVISAAFDKINFYIKQHLSKITSPIYKTTKIRDLKKM